jgi:hypothetical protein
MAIKERTTIMIDRELLAEAQNTAARIGIPLVVAGSISKFLRYLLQDFNKKNTPKNKKA